MEGKKQNRKRLVWKGLEKSNFSRSPFSPPQLSPNPTNPAKHLSFGDYQAQRFQTISFMLKRKNIV
jgi:hypothetical protein